VRNLLLQLDSSPHASVFDRVVALDAGADEVMSYGGVTEDSVRDLVHGVIFTRGPKDLRHSAIFIGGTDITVGERMLAAVRKSFFGPLKTSVMVDSNGSNTTAVAAVAKLQQAAGSVRGRRSLVAAGTGPVGMRAAGLLAKAGADVTITSRRPDRVAQAAAAIAQRFGGAVRGVAVADPAEATAVLEGMELLISAGPAGVRFLPRSSWAGRRGLIAAADLNAVPPLGLEGMEVTDDGADREGVMAFGALGVGGLKMKIHKACIARLFERNDLVLDADTIAEIASDLATSRPQSA
jgi:hypothetical protein